MLQYTPSPLSLQPDQEPSSIPIWWWERDSSFNTAHLVFCTSAIYLSFCASSSYSLCCNPLASVLCCVIVLYFVFTAYIEFLSTTSCIHQLPLLFLIVTAHFWVHLLLLLAFWAPSAPHPIFLNKNQPFPTVSRYKQTQMAKEIYKQHLKTAKISQPCWHHRNHVDTNYHPHTHHILWFHQAHWQWYNKQLSHHNHIYIRKWKHGSTSVRRLG